MYAWSLYLSISITLPFSLIVVSLSLHLYHSHSVDCEAAGKPERSQVSAVPRRHGAQGPGKDDTPASDPQTNMEQKQLQASEQLIQAWS